MRRKLYKKRVVFKVAFDEEEIALIKKEARDHKLPITHYIRMAVLENLSIPRRRKLYERA